MSLVWVLSYDHQNGGCQRSLKLRSEYFFKKKKTYLLNQHAQKKPKVWYKYEYILKVCFLTSIGH